MNERFNFSILSWLIICFVASLSYGSSMYAEDTYFSCQQIKDMPSPRSNVAAVSYNDKIYVIGGNDQDGATNTTFEFNPDAGTWESLPAMQNPRFGHGIFVFEDKIYVLGGMSVKDGKNSYERSIEAYDPMTKEWKTVGSMPFSRARFGLVVFFGRLLLIGGEDEEHSATSNVDVYDPEKGTWERKVELPAPRNRHAAITFDKDIYVAGGEDQHNNSLQSVIKYVLEEDRWVEVSPMSIARKNFAMTVLGPNIVVAGGWDTKEDTKIFHSNIEAFNPKLNTWTEIGTLNTERDGVRAISHCGKVYFFGGYNGRVLESLEQGQWMSRESMWTINQSIKFHLAYYSEHELDNDVSYSVKPLGFTKDYEPDITNINLKGFLGLGFPVPSRPAPEKYNFYLKFYEYPQTLDNTLSVENVLKPMLIFHTAKGETLRSYIKSKNNVVVKKGLIEQNNYAFSTSKPYPCLRALKKPASIDGKDLTPQEFFDKNIPFSSLYVKPLYQLKGDLNERGTQSAQGVVGFHDEILSIYANTFREIKSSEAKDTYYFIDDSSSYMNLKSKFSLNIIRVPKLPMMFKNFKDLPMPQNPKSVFLTGLILIYKAKYILKGAHIPKDPDEIYFLKKDSSDINCHVFEVGSVVDLKKD